jgi:predicted acyl esterase
MWLERLEYAVCFPELWLTHQRRDDYWKHGSVCEHYAAIGCPVYAIGGWADAYSNAIPRLLAALETPRKGLVGPWAHLYPHDGAPGPAIGFLQEALRWWDHWLKNIDTGIMAEPMMRVWMQESAPPKSFALKRPGRWVAENEWPSPRIRMQRYWLDLERLSATERGGGRVAIRSAQTTGLTAGEWCPFGAPGEAPRDQRSDDAYSLLFDSAPLEQRMEILGAPLAALEVTSDRPLALIALRLNDVAPDGASALVTYGLLNLTHHRGHADPEPLEPGKRYSTTVKLNDIAHAFPPGHRIRLAVSTSYWPIAWPAPHTATLTVILGESFLELPVRPPAPQDGALEPFAPPECAPSQAIQLRPAPLKRIIERDVTSDETICTISSETTDEHEVPAVVRLEAIDLEVSHTSIKRFRIREDDPLSAQAEVAHHTLFRRDGWNVRIETRARLSSTQDHFELQAEVRAYESEQQVFARDWNRRVKRDLV